jgi:protein-tyrosine phosphatase
MTGDSVQPRTFLEMAFSGEMDGITDTDVGEMYIGMLTRHANDFGRAINLAIAKAPSLYHCTAGKDRTGLFSMLVLGSLGVSDDDVLTDFTLSNEYRAEQRIKELAPLFAERGLDVEQYRPALSAPQLALEMAIEWLDESHGGPSNYLVEIAGLSDDDISAMRAALIRRTP